MNNNFNKPVGHRLYLAWKANWYSRAKVGKLIGLRENTTKKYEDGNCKINKYRTPKKPLAPNIYSAHETEGFNSNSAEVDSSKMSILYHNTFPTQVNTSSISSLMSYFEPLFEADSENHIILLFVLIWAVSLDVNSDAKTIVDLVLKPSIDQEKEAWEKLETDSTVVGDVTARPIISPWYRSTNSGTPMSASTKRCWRG